MTVEVAGGGSSAVAASSHAACARFRGTDPLITGITRRNLAKEVGFADTSGSIPQARWMRAMTFERLVRNENFAGQVTTRTAGALGLDRPTEVVTVDAHMSVDKTAQALSDAHARAVNDGAATLVFQLALPFVGFEESRATDVKPDFAVVAPSMDDPRASWLVIGDAKDYERVRSRIEDARMLKGFLQVAVGSESARAWSRLPDGMTVHTYGVLAVPRNAFLQPEPVVENLHDYAEEVKLRIDERRREAEESKHAIGDDVKALVAHLEAAFDPASCTTCTLFSYCRDELRRSDEPNDLLVEIGVARDMRRHALGLVDGITEVGRVPASTAANIAATLQGVPQFSGQRRVDRAGTPGTVNVVLAKSDAAALGVHGIGVQRVTAEGRGDWEITTFDEPQSPDTRRLVMRRIGAALHRAMREQRKAADGGPPGAVPGPVHLVVPDQTTADVLASIADNLAGVELSRLRWERDKEQGRPALTYDGEPATVPRPISETERTAIALLLEDDRSRAFRLRSPIIDVREVLSRHIVAGGPSANAGRLDYLVGWAEATDSDPIDHRSFADAIEISEHSPGARLTNTMSDAIHEALVGKRGKHGGAGAAEPELYTALVTEELRYKAQTLARALDALDRVGSSTLREAHRVIESDAQQVWRRRLELHASDLVRFGRTYRPWRNSLVPMIESDASCASQLLALSNPQAAQDMAADAGNRSVAFATVVSVGPLEIDVESRRIVAGSRVVMLMRNGEACVERPGIWVDSTPAGSVKVGELSIGPLTDTGEEPTRLRWDPQTVPVVEVGDRLVIADFAWFSDLKGNLVLPVAKPKPDATSAPKPDCEPDSYDDDPQTHRWCCRSHEHSESEFSDLIAERRARGELNPETWPPVRDKDAFEVSAAHAAAGDAFAIAPEAAPDDQTMDDLE
ncbi:hypothetical protein A5638_10450 [Mycolicibacterium fortuitum]|uniref:hypothetical protein n=1 Tax=Mycolicibacterium fortuitum TaxID=1766 RepID=UPI0007EDAE36|nr:hypothetical protein [Mycolicibacterium fortuitum]OBJ98399.1 hypothetical protein A5638_10450 [Mycolicibacterium fortuitum]